jgi:hypothetical protein
MTNLGKLLIVFGVVVAALGVLIILGERIGFGRLPGDLVIRRKSFVFYFPVVTCAVLSAILTLLLWILHGRR